MQAQTTERMTDGARFLARELVREPVKEAVREALREEALAIRTSDGDTRRTTGVQRSSARGGSNGGEHADRSNDDGSGRSKLVMGLVGVLVLAGATLYLRRKRRGPEQSSLSAFDEDTGGAATGAGFESDAGDAGETGETSEMGSSGQSGHPDTSSATSAE